MGELIPFPTDYLPTLEEAERLEGWQRQLCLWRAELIRQWDMKQLNAGERYISRERFHNGVRDNWKIYQGFKEEAAIRRKG